MDHQFKPDKDGLCKTMVHIKFEEGPWEAINKRTGEKVIITDDRSIYGRCGKALDDHKS